MPCKYQIFGHGLSSPAVAAQKSPLILINKILPFTCISFEENPAPNQMKKILDTSSCNNSVNSMNEKRKTIVSSVPSRGNIKRSYIFTNDWTLPNLHILSLFGKKMMKKLGSHTERKTTRKWKLFDLFKCISSHTSALTEILQLHATHCCNTITTQRSIWLKPITSVISDKSICQSFFSWQR